jgi:organic radical activating enzyme
MNYEYPRYGYRAYFIEVTNRCNLTCPHCYQEPDNTSKDLPIDYILEQIKSWPDDGYAISLAGAEPTVRKDLDVLINKIQELPGLPRHIIVLTNGVNLAKDEYVAKFAHFKNVSWTIGLNHPDYHSSAIRAKQIKGINNAKRLGLDLKNISYTLEDLSQLEYCLEEIQQFYPDTCSRFRIRVGADIGRNPEGDQIYLSQLVAATRVIAANKGWPVEVNHGFGIRAHYPLLINGVFVKLIQWPDATTLDLEEMQTETWADLVPGKPVSPLIHQVMLRDATVNQGLMLYDTVPQKYQR